MPRHKIERQEEVSTANWKQILTLAEHLDFSQARMVPPFQYWLSGCLALDWINGKRINEILTLKRKSITTTETQIKFRYHIGKKRSRGAPIELQPYQKNRNINHQAVPYILRYLEEYDNKISDQDTYLFPVNTQPRTRTVTTKFTNGKGEQQSKTYTYQDQAGHLYEENAQFWLTKINLQLPPNKRLYFHYGRHNIGISQAYKGRSDIQIADILDETPRAALEYTKHARGLSEDWSRETE